MELIKQSISVCDATAHGVMQAIADGDAIVPDVKPDILKLLQVDAEAYVTDKYIENGRLITAGRVDYKVLYVPDKTGETVSAVSVSMEFRQTADAGGADGTAVPLAAAAVERVEFSMVNSRKIRLRAIVSVRYEVCSVRERELTVDTAEDTAERKKRSIVFESAEDISEHDFSVKETVEIPSGQSSISEILKADVRICDTEYKTVTGKVIVKGGVNICILYTDDEGAVRYAEAETPFTEVLDTDGAGEDAVCDIDYSIIGVMCTAVPDSDGDMRMAEVDIDVCAAVKAFAKNELEILEDCFVPGEETLCGYEEIDLTNTESRQCAQNNIREVIDFPTDAPGVSAVYNVMTNAEVTKTELRRGKLLCEGNIEAFVLYLTDTAETPIYTIKKDIKFSYMMECETEGQGCEVSARAEVRHISYSLNAGGSLELRCLLQLDAVVTRKGRVRSIVTADNSGKSACHGVIIYFAKKNDAIWDVARRYGISCDAIIKYNEIGEEQLHGGERLFIPQG